ncbi:MAG: hypothetical protein KBD26_00785 [Candidatus Pacebacteria bacterium]|nr:hypothetical protein [Candidatus Paceibacterota bacterium]MBP9772346.1 hypothetical protein [Candidatus Paceibacterota bacterium]
MEKNSEVSNRTASKALDFLDSPEAQKMFNRIAAQEKARKRRAKIAWDKWEKEFTKNIIKKGKFNEWMDRLKKAHNKSYKMRLMSKGIEPHPNKNLYRTFYFAQDNGKEVNLRRKLDKYTPNEFTTSLVEYNGYYFHIIHGQGVGFKVLKATKNGKAEDFISI